MKKKIFSLAFAITLILSACSKEDNQPKKTENKSSGLSFLDNLEGLEEVYSPRKAARDFLIAKNLCKGLNDNGRFVSVGEVEIDADRNSKDFQQKRIEAYKEAILRAKKDISRYEAMEKEAENARKNRSQYFSESEINSSIISSSGKGNLKNLLPSDIYNELKPIKGVLEMKNFEEGESVSILEGIVPIDSLECFGDIEIIERTTNSAISGVIPYRFFEDDESVAVVMYYSDFTKKVAEGIKNYSFDIVSKNKEGDFVMNTINKFTEDGLLSSMGISLTKDEDGSIVLLSYGQSIIGKDRGASLENAKQMAIRNIESFAVSNIYSKAIFIKYVDYSNSERSGFKSTTKESFNNLGIDDIEPVHIWQITDEKTKQKLCGVVVALRFKNLQKKTIEDINYIYQQWQQ